MLPAWDVTYRSAPRLRRAASEAHRRCALSCATVPGWNGRYRAATSKAAGFSRSRRILERILFKPSPPFSDSSTGSCLGWVAALTARSKAAPTNPFTNSSTFNPDSFANFITFFFKCGSICATIHREECVSGSGFSLLVTVCCEGAASCVSGFSIPCVSSADCIKEPFLLVNSNPATIASLEHRSSRSDPLKNSR